MIARPPRPLFALLALSLFLAGCSQPVSEPPVPRTIRYMEVSTAEVSTQVDLAGEVRARSESGLGFQVSGRLIERKVNLGERVRRGQVLARLDDRDLQLARDAAAARLVSAEAELARTIADNQRIAELARKNYVSAAELAMSNTAVSAAKAARDQAQAKLRLQSNQQGYGVLEADADGVVIAVNADAGEVVNIGQPVIRIAREGAREIQVQFPEDRRDLAKLAAAEVSLWAAPQTRYPAQLRELSAAADPVTRTFTARYTVKAPEKLLELGQSATLHLSLPARAQGARIPTTAMFEYQNQPHVWRYDPQSQRVQRKPVQFAGIDGNQLLVLGLEAEDIIATAGVHVLQEGQQVRLLPPSTP